MAIRPIDRLGFYSQKDFDFDNVLRERYLEQDLHQVIYLYNVNRERSDTDTLYGEAYPNEVILENPIELLGIGKFNEKELKAYLQENSTIVYSELGNVTFDILLSHLKENNIEICIGDFLAYRFDEQNTRFFKVIDDGRTTEHLKYTVAGFKPFYKTIIGVPVDRDEIKTNR